ncbi:MAG: D-alanine--D-alanine ligase family protein [Betaproteobacteria bacterium]
MPELKPVQRPQDDYRKIVLLVDEETGTRLKSGRFVPDRGSVEARVQARLVAQYGEVTVIPFTRDVVATIEELRAARPDLVFNLTEWLDGDRSMDAAITGLLDLLKVPYTGTGPDGMRLARDKALSKEIVSRLGVAVPRHVVVNGTDDPASRALTYPLVVKPQFGDASETMSANSMVKNADELRERVESLRARLKAPLICEEFIPGRDLYVALLGPEPEVMPPVELVIGKKGSAAPQLATYRLKNDAAYRTRWRIRWKPAKLDDGAIGSIEAASRSIFDALKLRDYARLDFRLTPENRLYFLEANPNPDLHPHAMGINLCFAGVEHGEAIRRIVEAALSRAPSDKPERS